MTWENSTRPHMVKNFRTAWLGLEKHLRLYTSTVLCLINSEMVSSHFLVLVWCIYLCRHTHNVRKFLIQILVISCHTSTGWLRWGFYWHAIGWIPIHLNKKTTSLAAHIHLPQVTVGRRASVVRTNSIQRSPDSHHYLTSCESPRFMWYNYIKELSR